MFKNLYLKNNYATIYDTCVTTQLLDVVNSKLSKLCPQINNGALRWNQILTKIYRKNVLKSSYQEL